MRRFYKQKTLAVKLLARLLYPEPAGGVKFKRYHADGVQVTLTTGPLARSLYISNSALLTHLRYLEAEGVLLNLTRLAKGQYSIIVTPPLLFSGQPPA